VTGPATILVAGLPRSGTTWTAQVVARLADALVLHEPDNEKEWLSALAAKSRLGRFPVLRPGDDATGYAALWRLADLGRTGDSLSARTRLLQRAWHATPEPLRERVVAGRGRGLGRAWGPLDDPSTTVVPQRRRLVKSVHAPLALGWVTEAFHHPVRIVAVTRHPANLLGSWLHLGLPDRDRRLDAREDVRATYLDRWDVPLPGPDPVVRAAWQACLLTAALLEETGHHPDWLTVTHDDLCRDPGAGFAEIARRLGLPWTDAAATYLSRSDRPGEGYDLHRRTAELPDRWRTALPVPAREALGRVAPAFPYLERWRDDLVGLR
jgi:hypothetical protein